MADAATRTHGLRRLALRLFAAPIVCLPIALSAQDGGRTGESRRTMTALRVAADRSIELDGRLDEDLWAQAQPATDFLQEEPVEGGTPTERTEVFVLYTDTDLYIGARLHDSDPGGILAYQRQRDAGLGTDDRFMWILDTFLDGRTGYFFEINPAGLMGDGLLTPSGFGVNKSWDGIWEAHVARGDYGWSAEIRIPFRTLNFDPEQDAWGINFQRTVRRKNEEMRWTGHRRNQSLTRPVHAGRLTNLQGMTQGLGLEATPYAVAGWRNTPTEDPSVDPTDFPADAGFDLSYNVTPSLRASVTFNTDFAEVEVDQRQVNLTRFPISFPERRDFFLEGSGVFSFAERNGVNPYFSRSIGLVRGDPIPILYGARVGGQAGRYELGFVQVHTQSATPDTAFIPAEDFTVARIKRTFLDQSSIGLIYTRRATAADLAGNEVPDRHTVGADLDFFTSRFLGDRNFQFEAFFVWNSDPDPNGTSSMGDRTARGFRINYPNDLWRIHTSYRELPEEHAPAVGFTRRNGFRRLQPTVTFAPRPRDFLGIRQLEFQVQFEYLTDFEWVLETRSTDIRLLGLRFDSGDRLDLQVKQLFERLDEPFEIRDGIVVAMGDYNTFEWEASARTAGRRPISGGVGVASGQFWAGTRRAYEFDLTVKPAPGVQLSGTYAHNDIDLTDGSFTTNLFRVEGGWDVSPWASLTSNLQFDDVSDILGLFARFRWILQPGSELFLVYSHNWQQEPEDLLSPRRFRTLSRGGSTKLNYTIRF